MADTIGSIASQTNLLAEQSAEAVINIQYTIVKVQYAFKSSGDRDSEILVFMNGIRGLRFRV